MVLAPNNRMDNFVKISFKRVYIGNSISIELPISLKINELYNYIKPYIEQTYNTTRDFYILEAGTTEKETAPPIDLTQDKKLFNVYSKKNTAFYIKIKIYEQPENVIPDINNINEITDNNINNDNDNDNEIQEYNGCHICMNENIIEMVYLSCNHFCCINCFNILRRNTICLCPFCRSVIP